MGNSSAFRMKIFFFLHPGTNSRGILLDILHGFSAAGHQTVVWDTTPAANALAAEPDQELALRESVTQQLDQILTANSFDLAVGMWANGICMTVSTKVQDRTVTMFERLKLPLLCVWLDSPERSHRGTVVASFKTGFLKLPYQFHFINNFETALEMRRV